MANFTLTANDDSITGTAGNDFFGTATLSDHRGIDTLDGGAGRDTLSINYSTITSGVNAYGSAIQSDGAGGFSGYLYVGVPGSSDYSTTNFYSFEVLTIRLSGLDDYITLDAASIASGGTVNIGGGAGTDSLTIDFRGLGSTIFTVAPGGAITSNHGTYSGFENFALSLGLGTNTVETQDGTDNISGYDGGVNAIKTGAGDDRITTYDTVDTIDGGSGDDSWFAQRYSRVEDLTFTVNGTSAAISDGSSAINIERFNLFGGIGDDTFTVTNTTTGSFLGGGGTNTLNLDLSGTSTLYSDFTSQLSDDGNGAFNGNLFSGTGPYFNGIQHLNLTLDDSDNSVSVNAAPLAGAATLNLSGGLGNDILAIDFTNVADTSFVVAADGTITSSKGSFESFETFYINLGTGDNTVETQGTLDSIRTTAGGVNSISTGAGIGEIYSFDSVDTVSGGDDYDFWLINKQGSPDSLTYTINGTSATISDGSTGTGIDAFSVYAGAGNDTMTVSRIFQGQFDGGAGEDTLNLDTSGIPAVNGSSYCRINSNGSGGFTGVTDGTPFTFNNIEHLNLTLADSDSYIYVDAAPLAAGATLSLSGGLGNDQLTVDFRSAGSTNFVVAADGTITSNMGSYASLESFVIYLGAGTNTVQTGGNDDLIYAYDGGANTLRSGAGNDTIYTYDTVDIIDGGEGLDTWTASRGFSAAELVFTVNGTSATISDGSSATNVEYFSLIGNDVDNTFNVSGNNIGTFYGNFGRDTFNLDLTGTEGPYSYNNYIYSDLSGGFTGYVNGGGQNFYNMEQVSLKLDGTDNYAYVEAQNSRSGATLSIDGGGGNDTVQVKGLFASYAITDDGAGGFLINDIDASDGDYGQFTVKNVEYLQFDDQVYDLTVVHAGQYLVGSEGDEKLTGTDYNDKIDGRGGNDTLFGGAGIDTVSYEFAPGGVKVLLYQVGTAQPTESAGDDTLDDKFENLIGSQYRDRLWGNDLNNHIWGLGGNDYINGMEGADTMEGGAGDDYYGVDNAGDAIIEIDGEGSDTVASTISYGLAAHVERLVLVGTGTGLVGSGNAIGNRMTANAFGSTLLGGLGNDILTGGVGADTLEGGEDNDTLDGRGGADSLIGGSGNDLYVIDQFDAITEDFDGGIDTVNADFTYTLGDNVERLTQTGSANIDGTGNVLDNLIRGNGGNNTLSGLDGVDKLYGNNGNDTLLGGKGNDYLDGGAGLDNMIGGEGNDIYVVERASDLVTELGGQGTDTVNASINYTLGNEVEKLTLTGSANLKGDGNAVGNVITGNSGDNVIYGYGGGDNLIGGEGSDILTGGLGRDTLNGGAGVDYFRFDVLETSANRDTIADFVHGTDKIMLSGTAFTALVGSPISLTLGTAAATAADHLIYNQTTGALFYDADGVGGVAAVQIASLTTKPLLDAGDFLLVA